MSSRTSWKWCVVALGLLTTPWQAFAQIGPPAFETPLPLMWGEREEGAYFAAEVMFRRMNNPIQAQPIVYRGLWDEAGIISGRGNLIRIEDGRVDPQQLITFLFDQRGTPGQFLGSGQVAMSTSDVDGDKFTPGTRLTVGYRLRNGIAIEGSYWWQSAARHTSTAGIIPPRGLPGGVGQNFFNSFISAPFFNFSPDFGGPEREVVSNVFLYPNPGTNPIILVTPGAANGNPANWVTLFDDALIDEIIQLGGTPVAAYGIGNGAEIAEQGFRQRFANFELNGRVPILQTEVTRTYGTGGFRYIGTEERYRLRMVDLDLDGFSNPINDMTYQNKIRNHMYGPQVGTGSEIYINNGFSLSLQAKVGVMAVTSKASTSIKRGDALAEYKHVENETTVGTMFEGGAYLWWYPIEGIQLRVGYEYLGIVGVRRSTHPVDFDLGKLQPIMRNTYMSVDGFTAGIAFIF